MHAEPPFFVPLPVLSNAHCAEPVGGKRPGVTCQSVSPSLGGPRVRAGSVRPCASAPDGAQWSGPVLAGAAEPSVCVAAGFLSQSQPGLQVSRYGSRVASCGRCLRGHGLGAAHSLGARFWAKGHGPVAQPAAGRRVAGSCSFVSGLRARLHLWISVCRPPLSCSSALFLFIVHPLYTCSCLISPCY
jgi:hypothetical protein